MAMEEVVGTEALPLPGLEDELTCAICLELLQEPVTAPCGHNFCRACLALYWAPERPDLTGYSCPQCRCRWAQRPELKPNRVLCTVVSGLERLRCGGAGPEDKPKGCVKPEVLPCDACPPASAAAALRTCLTCLASFCAEHLEPHGHSPALRSHTLRPPLPDLAQRRCPDHDKLLEFRCPQHKCCLCAVCLLEHRACATVVEEEARGQRQEELKVQQKTVEYEIIQLQHSVEMMNFQKEHVKDSSGTQRAVVEGEFAEMKAMIEREERMANKLIEEEENRADTRCAARLDQMSSRLEKLKEYKEQLKSALAHKGGITFWKRVEYLQVPLDTSTSQEQVEVDAKKLVHIAKAVSAIRGKLTKQLKISLEQRVQQLEQAGCLLGREPIFAERKEKVEASKPSEDKQPKTKKNKNTRMKNNGPMHGQNQTEIPGKGKPTLIQSLVHGPHIADRPERPSTCISSATQKRQNFLQYNTRVTFNQRSAHKKLLLGNHYTSLSIAEQPQDYPNLPERFYNCCQVLGFQRFTNGRHYWEVGIQGNGFWAIGVACAGIERSGSCSRLGRNALSWCVERFGLKLSAWHASQEVPLLGPPPRVVGVYLDFETREVAFYSVGATMLLLCQFRGALRDQILPAFWLCSSGTKLTLG
ncbi:E3 ubiquitin/ISG15 ligase TRIM25 isoform X2 [Narcine bancroftii]|uniref:E3 ubiquitin/ISG15 ligase TRIM25 isoform X2 n=1 Tax=Narcine bancroftii TaxID=1343680 RepID=UPI00383172B8